MIELNRTNAAEVALERITELEERLERLEALVELFEKSGAANRRLALGAQRLTNEVTPRNLGSENKWSLTATSRKHDESAPKQFGVQREDGTGCRGGRKDAD